MKLLLFLVSLLTYLVRLYIGYIVSLFYKNETLWIISERGHEARDNGYFFFLYCKRNHPELNVKYVISKDSQDREKMKEYKHDLVALGSWKHYVLLWRASHLISTHIMGYTPNHVYFTFLDKKIHILRNKKKVFLQHGIIKDDLPQLYGNSVHLDLFVCGALEEYEYICKTFKHKPNVVQYTGLCRYDNLLSCQPKKQLLIMPTWRSYIDKSQFEDSEYYKVYSFLLTDKKFQSILEKYNYEAVFYPHYEIQSNIGSFKKLKLSDRVHIASFESDVQTLLKESSLLITDFSSVYFDMAYMHKPILLYQFDREKYHYKPGYFDVNNIGQVSIEQSDLLDNLDKVILNGCHMDKKYINYVDHFFKYRDSFNSKRVFDAITNIV